MGFLAKTLFRSLIGPRLHCDASRPISAAHAREYERAYRSVLGSSDPVLPRIDRPFAVYDMLRYLLVTRPVAFHGSTHPKIDVIVPSSVERRHNVTCRFAYASTSLLRVVQHSFHKQVVRLHWEGGLPIDAGRNPIIGASYIIGHDLSDTYAFFSINDQLLDVDLGEVTIYVCSVNDFLKAPLYEDGYIAEFTGGEVNGSIKLSAAEGVRPFARVGFRLSDLPFGYGHHRRNERFLSILWNFRRRAGLRHPVAAPVVSSERPGQQQLT